MDTAAHPTYLRAEYMTYPETIDFLYSRLPMFSRIGESAIKKDLTNTRLLCEFLGHPEQQFKSIHVAGTNGKGSTSHMLAAALQSNGYTTGLYTSPHLYDFRERIKVNGSMISQDFVVSFVERLRPAIASIDPSFFEVTVAMAFAYLAEQQVDIAVIETGLGGRLDSTNILLPEISVITNIGRDHMNLLGETLTQIAGEKAGIIKSGIPVVIGERHPETTPVFESTAAARQAPLYYADNHYRTKTLQEQGQQLHVSIYNILKDKEQPFILDLPGRYQAKNLATVLTALDVFQQNSRMLEEQAVTKGINQTRALTGFRGRWETIRQEPRVIIDVAHNEDGIRVVLDQLQNTPFHKLHWIFGVVKDKDYQQMLQLLPPDASYYFTKAQIPRALDEHQLTQMAAAAGLKGDAYPDARQALEAALHAAEAEDLILVCGSIFLAGELLSGGGSL